MVISVVGSANKLTHSVVSYIFSCPPTRNLPNEVHSFLLACDAKLRNLTSLTVFLVKQQYSSLGKA